jgi:hypothetical protein
MVVESPTKAAKIQKFLGDDYKVTAAAAATLVAEGGLQLEANNTRSKQLCGVGSDVAAATVCLPADTFSAARAAGRCLSTSGACVCSCSC